MTVAEANKMIDKFMGNEREFTQEAGWVAHTPYHGSWHWLMPVVEKISRITIKWENSDDRTDTYYPRTFAMINDETGKIMVRFNGNTLHEADTLIEATYNAVIDFIQHYKP
jgi:hypothetical protein